jgi:chemosensory pili system protein ChpB (putative protein-glutamate methylesterase)
MSVMNQSQMATKTADLVKIGAICDDLAQQGHIRSALTHFGCTVSIYSPSTLSTDYLKAHVKEYGAWLISLADEDSWVDLMVELVELERPVLFGLDGAPPKHTEEYPYWEKRLYGKLCELLGRDLIADSTRASMEALAEEAETGSFTLLDSSDPSAPALEPEDTSDEAADHIWVICASLGGPDAVKRFLDRLPKGLPLGFLYAQHIDANFESVLVQVLGRHSHYKMVKAQKGNRVKAGEVVMVPVAQEMMIDDDERMRFLGRPWPGPYGPSVDQAMLNVHQRYPKAGFLIFSGMGNDGATAAMELKKTKVQVWAQTTETCANSSMPDSVRDTQAVSFSGTPEEMAERLALWVKSQMLATMNT